MNSEEKARIRVCDYQRSKAIKRLLACTDFVLDGIEEIPYSDRLSAAIANADHAEIGRLILEHAAHQADKILDDITRGVTEFETPMQLVHEHERNEEKLQFVKARFGDRYSA